MTKLASSALSICLYMLFASLRPAWGLTALSGRCEPALVQNAFPKESALRILVVRPASDSGEPSKFGTQLARSLSDAFSASHNDSNDVYNETLKNINGGTSGIKTQYVGCTIENSAHARSIGQAASAHLVIWGKLICKSTEQCVRINLDVSQGAAVNSGNAITNSPGAQMNNIVKMQVNVPESVQANSFKLYLTATQWHWFQPELSFSSSTKLSDPRSFRLFDLREFALPDLPSPQSSFYPSCILGLFLLKNRDYGESVKLFQRALEEVSDKDRNYDLYNAMGIAYGFTRDGKGQGTTMLKRALAGCPNNDLQCRAVILHNIGWIEDGWLNEFETIEIIIGYSKRALMLRRQIKDQIGEADTLSNLATFDINHRQGSEQEALAYLEQALPLYQKENDRTSEAITLYRIGQVHVELGHKEKAVSFYESAVTIARQLGNIDFQAQALSKLCGLYSDKQKTRSCLEFVLPLVQGLKLPMTVLETIVSLAKVYSELGEEQKLHEVFDTVPGLLKRESIFEDCIYLESPLRNEIAHLYLASGNPKQAIISYHNAAACDMNKLAHKPNFPKPQGAIASLHLAYEIASRNSFKVEMAETIGRIVDVVVETCGRWSADECIQAWEPPLPEEVQPRIQAIIAGIKKAELKRKER